MLVSCMCQGLLLQSPWRKIYSTDFNLLSCHFYTNKADRFLKAACLLHMMDHFVELKALDLNNSFHKLCPLTLRAPYLCNCSPT